jgi:sulfite reductase (NADPH) hemoprotein beta-component
VVENAGLAHDAITIRMTGCPNGCGRPFLAEIAFVGRAPGKYNLYLGGSHAGNRLNKLYRESVTREEAVALLTPAIQDYARTREDGERFGDFVIRKGYVEATVNGLDFHENLKPEATSA